MERQNLQQNLYQFQINILYQKVLQSSALELLQICETSVEENPFLEIEKIYSHFSLPEYVVNNISARESISNRLKMEIAYLNLDPAVSQVAELIVELIDDDGYLRVSLDEICRITKKDMTVVQNALNAIQSLEPPGIAARNFQECFILQMKARKLEGTLAFRVLCECGQELLAGKLSLVKRKMKITDDELSSVIAEIRKLDPFPARSFSLEPVDILPKFPDFIIKSIEPVISIEFGEDRIFKIFINETYVRMLRNKVISGNEKSFLNEKLHQARKLIVCIENRKQFLERLVKYIVDYQKDFICCRSSLRPLTESQLAEKFSCSVSLISRAISGKYISYGASIFPVKKLFSYSSSKQSQDYIIDEIETIIKNSDAFLSDRQISEKLKEKGIVIAPRTVNKYRRKREILNSYLRRSFDTLENSK